MPLESDQKVEEVLRAYAKSRREAAGAPFEMPPATRSLLQAEVRRIYGQEALPFPARFNRVFAWWPRLAWGGAIFAVLALVLLTLIHSPPNTSDKTQSARNAPSPQTGVVPVKPERAAKRAPELTLKEKGRSLENASPTSTLALPQQPEALSRRPLFEAARPDRVEDLALRDKSEGELAGEARLPTRASPLATAPATSFAAASQPANPAALNEGLRQGTATGGAGRGDGGRLGTVRGLARPGAGPTPSPLGRDSFQLAENRTANPPGGPPAAAQPAIKAPTNPVSNDTAAPNATPLLEREAVDKIARLDRKAGERLMEQGSSAQKPASAVGGIAAGMAGVAQSVGDTNLQNDAKVVLAEGSLVAAAPTDRRLAYAFAQDLRQVTHPAPGSPVRLRFSTAPPAAPVAEKAKLAAAAKPVSEEAVGFRDLATREQPARVLASFVLERTGEQILLLDSDGSTYLGQVVNAPPAFMDRAYFGLRLTREESAEARQLKGLEVARSNAASTTASQMGPYFYFRAGGTNVTLELPVQINGWLAPGGGGESQPAETVAAERSRHSPPPAPRSRTSPVKLLLKGQALVGPTNQIPIDAVATIPPTQ